ncbi:hypothetical protein C1I97_25195 [Streptomyces sp. NTH33]|uniref:helix-turn-helix domain-containing protein n=1 Tax=Streptomyces sp. NTH33 TaxID=1735453 RepID=UPI000DAA9BDC|nr:helix-turn-helix domain-containing protein [Streptomyces sp. NTH33]PZG97834.1 hypothetical protein C1I97_25195 [Streptomyces sp. NTH33]
MAAAQSSPTSDLIYIDEIAERLGVRPNTIRTWRYKGRGPRTWRQNGRVVSTVEDIEKYLAAQVKATERGAV